MKDFKTLPKMKCGGGVKKYAEGSSVGDIVEAIRSGKAKPVPMPSGQGHESGVDIPGYGRVKPVEMPQLKNDNEVNIPGVGRFKPSSIKTKTRGDLQLLKKGGKTKRGNKK